MSWQTFGIERRDDRYGPYAPLVDGGHQSAEVILLQRNDTGKTRAVLGFLVGAEYVPIEDLPGWTGEMPQHGIRTEVLR
ncbi:hypothetical protein [Gordonia sp. SCSIO 19800]|uniref:hypothetical protein n=1 Tax=Gordonia sp. SCSIO 19800 TaxID=2826926 RepID=UPI001B82573D|nr:hypothetical protein [Gordonia sp. SCSIO 19800]MBR7191922.1 hypothetical protein [Gordonia sp. SCSIO 19800]